MICLGVCIIPTDVKGKYSYWNLKGFAARSLIVCFQIMPNLTAKMGLPGCYESTPNSVTQAESKFVFVPGPGDAGPAHVLPRPPLARFLTADLREALPDAVFASNPCRIRYGTQELVLFRDDIEQRMRRQVLVHPSGEWLT